MENKCTLIMFVKISNHLFNNESELGTYVPKLIKIYSVEST